MRHFAGIATDRGTYEDAEVFLQPIAYDGTSTWGKGADRGPEALLNAAENMELYDIETGGEPYLRGVHILPTLTGFESPEIMFQCVVEAVEKHIVRENLMTFLGGEHSITIGIIEAFQKRHPGLSVLQIDAHADLRREYEGVELNHACAVHRASQYANLVQVGIRSMDRSELEFMVRDKTFFADRIAAEDTWMEESISRLKDPLYITLDLDALDPSIMPATGTPEPGGIGWYPLLRYLRKVFAARRVVGFDLVELAPIPQYSAPQFLAAKLYYKMLAYYFSPHE